MKIKQSNKFKKAYKKLHKNQRHEVNDALRKIIKTPNIGQQKKGELSWLRVYKCKILNQVTLIGYNVDTQFITLTFVSLGSHENFYRDLH